MPGQVMPKMPVSKNGKFFGYADARQIARNASLEVFDASKAEAIERAKVVDEQKAADAKAAEMRKASEGKAADPADVVKKPAGK